MTKVLFLKTCARDGIKYKRGKIYELPLDVANVFKNEGHATECEDYFGIESVQGVEDKFNQINSELDAKANLTTTSNLQNQINDLVLESGGDGNLEVVQARNGFDNLNGNINNIYNTIHGYKRNYQFLDASNYTDGFYYMFFSTDAGTMPPTIQTDVNANCSIYPSIRLYGGVTYYFKDLYLDFCRVLTLDGNTQITKLTGLTSYTATQDCLLYITVLKNNKNTAMFANCELPKSYKYGHLYTSIDKLKITDKLSVNDVDFIKIKTQFIIIDNNTQKGYYSRTSGNIVQNDACYAIDKIRIEMGKTYSFKDIYGYFSIFKYDDGTIQTITDDAATKYTGSMIASKSGYALISVKNTYKDSSMFVNDENIPRYCIGDYDYKFTLDNSNKSEIIVKKDGTEDYTSIVSAVNKANETGNVDIYIHSGEYNLLEELGG